MTTYSEDKYAEIVNDLLAQSSNRTRIGITFDELIKGKMKLSIDSFLSLLYSMFSDNNMIIDDKSQDIQNRNKFFYTEAYPDTTNDSYTNNVVTFSILQRKPITYDTKAIAGSTKQLRPRYLCEVKDLFENELALFYESSYENVVQFMCWSEKSEDVRLVASMIENFFIKNYWKLRNHIGTYEYLGRGQTIVSTDYGNKRLFGVPLVYNFRTEEPGFIRQSEIVSVDTSLQVIKSSIEEDILKFMK